MKKIFLLIIPLLLFLFTVDVYSQSSIIYDSGTTLDITSPADVCADTITINGNFTGNGTKCNSSFGLVLHLTAFLQGYTNTGGTAMNFAPSPVTVELHNATTPWGLVESQTGALSTAGVGTFTFANAASGTNYYIAVKTWNTVETWSASGQSFTSGALSYDFTSAATQAYASNMMQIGSKWCLYSGDVNQDGYINLTDLNQVNNDSYNQVRGVVVTDLTGDQYTNLIDLNIVNNNSYNQVKARTPLLNPGTSQTNPIMVKRPQIKNEK